MSTDGQVVDEGDDYICITFEVCRWEFANGQILLQEDWPVGGEIWRVHLSDPDPYPSDPHAHCIEGRNKGLKLHLGTRQLFTSKNKPTDKYLQKDQFERLLVGVRKKFPGVTFPLQN